MPLQFTCTDLAVVSVLPEQVTVLGQEMVRFFTFDVMLLQLDPLGNAVEREYWLVSTPLHCAGRFM